MRESAERSCKLAFYHVQVYWSAVGIQSQKGPCRQWVDMSVGSRLDGQEEDSKAVDYEAPLIFLTLSPVYYLLRVLKSFSFS